MLSKEDNELITRVGPGTPMGELMRQYWIPAMLSSELPSPDSDPVRILLLGERLVAFRDTSGRVGLMPHNCPHRGASLFFGRNEENGLRCVYHGWKFDVEGHCVDMPNEPAESDFKAKVRAAAYPGVERGGLVWTYMGPRSTPPPLPDLEPNMLPNARIDIQLDQQESNWLQVLEGSLDDSHAAFMHRGSYGPADVKKGTFVYYELRDRTPRSFVVDTDGGVTYAARRNAEPGQHFWRIMHWFFPFFTMSPVAVLGLESRFVCRVPMDDEHTLQYFVKAVDTDEELEAVQDHLRRQFSGAGLQPNSTDWHGRWRTVQGSVNDYGIDREVQRRNQGLSGYTGVDGIVNQDGVATWSMGSPYDRTREHLGSTDAMIIRVRRRLIQATRALAENGTTPPGVDHPEVYRLRAGGLFLPEGADWIEATRDKQRAFMPRSEVDPAVLGTY